MLEWTERPAVQKAWHTSLGAVTTAYDWVRSRLWPIYSGAMLLCVFQMIATASEKQVMADHYYGDPDKTFDKNKNELVQDSKTYFNEEVTLAIKERVWQLPERAFRREYAERHN